MKKESEGIVIELRGDMALVRPTECAYGGCGCHDEDMKVVILEMKNERNAAVGDRVVFEAVEGGTLKGAFVIFIMPILLVFGGAALGDYLAAEIGINSKLASTAGAILFFLISVAIIRMHDRSASRNADLNPVMVRKMTDNTMV